MELQELQSYFGFADTTQNKFHLTVFVTMPPIAFSFLLRNDNVAIALSNIQSFWNYRQRKHMFKTIYVLTYMHSLMYFF